MDGSRPNSHRDDRAWPRGATLGSALMGSAALGFGILIAVNHRYPMLATLALAAGTAIAAWLMLVGFRYWFAGDDIFAPLSLVAGAVAFPTSIVMYIFDRTLALTFALGLGTGCMLVNLWAVRKARRNRLRVNHC